MSAPVPEEQGANECQPAGLVLSKGDITRFPVNAGKVLLIVLDIIYSPLFPDEHHDTTRSVLSSKSASDFNSHESRSAGPY